MSDPDDRQVAIERGREVPKDREEKLTCFGIIQIYSTDLRTDSLLEERAFDTSIISKITHTTHPCTNNNLDR